MSDADSNVFFRPEPVDDRMGGGNGGANVRHRVRELDEIKAKLAETEAKLQGRLDSQQESIDLQLKLFLHEADGLGLFRPEDSLDLLPAVNLGRRPQNGPFRMYGL